MIRMAKLKTFTVGYGLSIQVKEIWHKFSCEVGVELEKTDDIIEVKEKAWNTAFNEVEKQFQNVIAKL